MEKKEIVIQKKYSVEIFEIILYKKTFIFSFILFIYFFFCIFFFINFFSVYIFIVNLLLFMFVFISI